MGDDDKATYAKLNHIELVIQDLIRLGIISRTEKTATKRPLSIGPNSHAHEGQRDSLED